MPPLPETIATARLQLRPFAFDDLEDLLAYAGDEEWSKYLPVPHPYERKDGVEFIAQKTLEDRTRSATWALELDGHVVGGIDIRLWRDQGSAMMGWSIARTCWGRGLVTEAAYAVIDATFTTSPEIIKIEATADARNIGSRRVMEKVGMLHEGTLRQHRVLRGEPSDEVVYGITRADWATSRARAT